MMSTKTIENATSEIRSQDLHIAGINTTIFGLDEVRKTMKSVSCLWLLHPRLRTKDDMETIAIACIKNWYTQPLSSEIGLIAVSFDQRNHGSRLVDPLANLSWRKGNERHSIDMFSIFHGTAVDTNLLIDHLGSYLFQGSNLPEINDHMVLGVSLGGHSAWQVLLNVRNVSCGVVIIGCPDYTSLMTDRAQRSGRETAGTNFLGSKDFPRDLIKVIENRDPKGILFGVNEVVLNPSDTVQKRLREILDSRLKNKKILSCSGGDDRLVPYHCTEKFLKFLENASTGWYEDGNIQLQNKIYPGVGHTFSDDMIRDSVRFITEHLNTTGGKIPSKV